MDDNTEVAKHTTKGEGTHNVSEDINTINVKMKSNHALPTRFDDLSISNENISFNDDESFGVNTQPSFSKQIDPTYTNISKQRATDQPSVIKTEIQGDEFDNLSDDYVQIFGCISDYVPENIKLETKLKPFLPSYIPSIGQPDPFLKVPRPDGVEDGLGFITLDEVLEEKQSDAAVLELQLRYQAKKKVNIGTTVRSIDDAGRKPEEIDRWIENVKKIHQSKPPIRINYTVNMPDIQNLMTPFPQELHDILELKMTNSFDPHINLSLKEYGKILCAMLDIPVQNESLIDSLHMIFKLGLKVQEEEL